jgi:hypothetical protein
MAKKPATPKSSPAAEAGYTDAPKVSAIQADQALTLYGSNPYSLDMPENMPEKDYLSFGAVIGKAMEFASWRIGDWVNYGQKQYGYKDYEKIAAVSGLAEQYLRACSSVASRVPTEFRNFYSLEKFRLMLSRRNESEKIEHLAKRLGGKTMTQLREMSGSGRGKDKATKQGMTATEVHTMLGSICEAAPTFSPEKLTIFASLNAQKDNLSNARAVLEKLADVLEQIAAEVDAKADIKDDKEPF